MTRALLDHEAIRKVAFWLDRARMVEVYPDDNPKQMLQMTREAICELEQYAARRSVGETHAD